MSDDVLAPTPRTTVKRLAERGRYERDVLYSILDAGLVCHVGFALDGKPWVIPTAYARIDDRLYVHGAQGNHMLRSVAAGAEACVTVTLLDGLVLARSAFHHSMNYRSVMVFGRAERVDDPVEKRAALDALVEHIARGRSSDPRPPTPEELRATLLIRLPITEASAKVRAGGPVEEASDLDLPHWAGVLPLRLDPSPPVPDDVAAARGLPPPGYLVEWSRDA